MCYFFLNRVSISPSCRFWAPPRQTRVAHLTSLLLLEVTVARFPGARHHTSITADIEPSLLALRMNNRAWFYLLGKNNVDLLADMQLNPDYCAVRYEGKIQLHVLEGEGVVTEDRERERERDWSKGLTWAEALCQRSNTSPASRIFQ